MANLHTRTLGRTGLEVTTLGFGAMELRGAPRGRDITPEQAERVLNGVLDGGINYIDTSIDYGSSEELIGRFISHRRSEYYLATKCGCLVGDQAAVPGQRFPHLYTRENIVAGVEQSLARMKTDYLDVVQFHGNPSKETLEENDAVATLLGLREQGKIRFIGMSSTLPNILDHIEMGVFDVFQIPYSSLELEHHDAITSGASAGSGTVIRGGVAKGSPSDEKQQGNEWDLWKRADLDDLLDGATRMEFLLRFTLSHPSLHTTIVGTLNTQHLQDNIDAAQKGPLPDDVYQQAKLRMDKAKQG